MFKTNQILDKLSSIDKKLSQLIILIKNQRIKEITDNAIKGGKA